MLRLRDEIKIDQLKPLGFNSYKQDGFTTYYRCFANGAKLMIINIEDNTTPQELKEFIIRDLVIDDWRDLDTRIPDKPKCKYRDNTTVNEMIYELTIRNFIDRV